MFQCVLTAGKPASLTSAANLYADKGVSSEVFMTTTNGTRLEKHI
jgi:hypothetical protein